MSRSVMGNPHYGQLCCVALVAIYSRTSLLIYCYALRTSKTNRIAWRYFRATPRRERVKHPSNEGWRDATNSRTACVGCRVVSVALSLVKLDSDNSVSRNRSCHLTGRNSTYRVDSRSAETAVQPARAAQKGRNY